VFLNVKYVVRLGLVMAPSEDVATMPISATPNTVWSTFRASMLSSLYFVRGGNHRPLG
jgi:hypothetical protein